MQDALYYYWILAPPSQDSVLTKRVLPHLERLSSQKNHHQTTKKDLNPKTIIQRIIVTTPQTRAILYASFSGTPAFRKSTPVMPNKMPSGNKINQTTSSTVSVKFSNATLPKAGLVFVFNELTKLLNA